MADPVSEVTTPADARSDADTVDADTVDATTVESEGADADRADADEVDADAEGEAGLGPDSDSADAMDGKDLSTHRRRRRALRWSGAAVVVAVTSAAVAGIVVFTMRHADATDRAARDREVAARTSDIAAQLVTLSASTADKDVANIRAQATGTFLTQLSDTTGSFAEVLTQGQVQSTGKATQVAVQDSSRDRATTLAAVTSTVKNSQAPQGEQRVYRMRLSLEKQDGRWLVSNVEFVA